MQFEYVRGLIYVPMIVSYNRQQRRLKAIVDTGSAGTAVDIKAFRMDLGRESEVKFLVGIGGKQKALIQKVESVTLGDRQCPQYPIEFCDIHNKFGIEAFIGSRLLKSLLAVVDFKTEEIRI